MYIDEQNGRPELVFYGDEIDSALRIATASRALRVDWLDAEVAIRGVPFRDGEQGRVGTRRGDKAITVEARIHAAYEWGYIRTLQVRRAQEAPIRVGGQNAVVEDLALEEMRFRTRGRRITRQQLLNRLHCLRSAGDTENKLLRHEACRDTADIVAQLHGLVEVIQGTVKSEHAGERQRSLRIVVMRLNALARYHSEAGTSPGVDEKLRTIMATMLQLAKGDGILRRYVAEAIFYWSAVLVVPFFEPLAALVKEVLDLSRNDSDLHTRLAALVSSARLEAEWPAAVASSLSMYYGSWSAENPTFVYVQATCLDVWMRLREVCNTTDIKALEIFLDTLSTLPGKDQGPPSLEGTLRHIRAIGDSNERGRAFKGLICAMLWMSGRFKDIESEVSIGELGRIDILGRLARKLDKYPEDFPVVFEAKSYRKSMDDQKISDQLMRYATFQRRRADGEGRVLVVLMCDGPVSRSLRDTLIRQSAVRGERFVLIDSATLERMVRAPSRCYNILVEAIPKGSGDR